MRLFLIRAFRTNLYYRPRLREGSGHGPLSRYVKLRVAHAPGMPGTFSPSPTSKETTNYPACITARAVMHPGIANPRWRGKRSRHSRRMRNPQFYISGKRPMGLCVLALGLSASALVATHFPGHVGPNWKHKIRWWRLGNLLTNLPVVLKQCLLVSHENSWFVTRSKRDWIPGTVPNLGSAGILGRVGPKTGSQDGCNRGP